jgi:hypothetical protein
MAKDGKQRSRAPGLYLTDKGEAALEARRRGVVREDDDLHGLCDWVAICSCKCGLVFESPHGGAPTDALTLLYDHLNKVQGGVG